MEVSLSEKEELVSAQVISNLATLETIKSNIISNNLVFVGGAKVDRSG